MGRPWPWTQIAITAVVAGLVLWRARMPALWEAFQNLNARNLLLAIFCLFVVLSLRAYKWHRLMDEGLGGIRLRHSLRSLFGGFALGLVTPGRLGELGRCLFVRKQERMQVGILNLLDRLFDLWALLTLACASLFFLVPHPAAVFGVAVWLALLPLVAGLPSFLAYLARLLRRPEHLQAGIADAVGVLTRIRAPRYAVLAACALWAELAFFFFLLRAFHAAAFITAVATYPYILMAGDLPVSCSGVGVREGAAALLLSPYAIPTGVAVDATLLWFAFTVLLPAALGGLWLLVDRTRSKLRSSEVVVIGIAPAWEPPESPTPQDAAEQVHPHSREQPAHRPALP